MGNPKESARFLQDKKSGLFIGRILKLLAKLIRRDSEPTAFVVKKGEVYTSEQVLRAYGIGPNTLEAWIGEGLRFGRRGTRSRYFLGDHLINFMFGE